MAYYVFQAPYTAEAIANMVKAPQNRAEAVRVAVEKMGGRLKDFGSRLASTIRSRSSSCPIT